MWILWYFSESSDEESDSIHMHMSEFEKRREKNIKRNKKVISNLQLQLDDKKEDHAQKKQNPVGL